MLWAKKIVIGSQVHISAFIFQNLRFNFIFSALQEEPRRQGIFRKSRKTILQEPRSNGNLNNQLTIVNKQLTFHQRPTLRRHILYITSVGIFNRIFN